MERRWAELLAFRTIGLEATEIECSDGNRSSIKSAAQTPESANHESYCSASPSSRESEQEYWSPQSVALRHSLSLIECSHQRACVSAG
jgi:hypothetical protein